MGSGASFVQQQVLQQQARAAGAGGSPASSPGAGVITKPTNGAADRRVAERVARARAAAGAGRTVAHSFGAQLQSAGPAAELRT